MTKIDLFVSNHSLDLIDDIRKRNFGFYNVIRKIRISKVSNFELVAKITRFYVLKKGFFAPRLFSTTRYYTLAAENIDPEIPYLSIKA